MDELSSVGTFGIPSLGKSFDCFRFKNRRGLGCVNPRGDADCTCCVGTAEVAFLTLPNRVPLLSPEEVLGGGGGGNNDDDNDGGGKKRRR